MFIEDKIVLMVNEWSHSESTHRIDSLELVKNIVIMCSEEIVKDIENCDPRVDEKVVTRSSVMKMCRSYDNAVEKLNKMGIFFMRKGAFYDFMINQVPELKEIMI